MPGIIIKTKIKNKSYFLLVKERKEDDKGKWSGFEGSYDKEKKEDNSYNKLSKIYKLSESLKSDKYKVFCAFRELLEESYGVIVKREKLNNFKEVLKIHNNLFKKKQKINNQHFFLLNVNAHIHGKVNNQKELNNKWRRALINAKSYCKKKNSWYIKYLFNGKERGEGMWEKDEKNLAWVTKKELEDLCVNKTKYIQGKKITLRGFDKGNWFCNSVVRKLFSKNRTRKKKVGGGTTHTQIDVRTLLGASGGGKRKTKRKSLAHSVILSYIRGEK